MRTLTLAILIGCGGPAALDQPAPPPEWPLTNLTDVKRTVRTKPVGVGAPDMVLPDAPPDGSVPPEPPAVEAPPVEVPAPPEPP